VRGGEGRGVRGGRRMGMEGVVMGGGIVLGRQI